MSMSTTPLLICWRLTVRGASNWGRSCVLRMDRAGDEMREVGQVEGKCDEVVGVLTAVTIDVDDVRDALERIETDPDRKQDLES